MKKLLIILIFLLPLFGCGQTESDTTDNPSTYSYLKYKKVKSEYEITGLENNYPAEIVIPETIKGSLVKAISSRAFENSKIESLEIPSNVESIGEKILNNSTIKKITIPAGYNLDEVFANQTIDNLTELKFSEGSKTIYNNKYDKFAKQIIKLELPNSVEVIKEGAFKGFTNLLDITIPGHISFKDHFAKNEIVSVKNVTISSGSINVINNSFQATSIENVYIPNTVKVIYRSAFSNTTNLSNITFEDGSKLESIQQQAFYGSGISTLTLPDSVTHLGEGAFGSSKISKIDLSNVTSLEDGVFASCKNLVDITIPKSVKVVKANAFSKCQNLITVIVESTDISFEDNVFYESTFLSSINFSMSFSSKIDLQLADYRDIIVWDYKIS